MKAKINRDAFLSISGVFLALNTPKNSLTKSSTVFESGNLHVVEPKREHEFRTDIWSVSEYFVNNCRTPIPKLGQLFEALKARKLNINLKDMN